MNYRYDYVSKPFSDLVVQIIVSKSFKQTPLERNISILLYLKKYDGEWKNKNEIATYSTGHGLNRKRLDEILLFLKPNLLKFRILH